MFDWKPVAVHRENIAVDVSRPIDMILDQAMVSKIYSNWDISKYGDPLDFGGGVKAITSSMLLDAGKEFLESIQGIGPKKADAILEKVRGDHEIHIPYK